MNIHLGFIQNFKFKLQHKNLLKCINNLKKIECLKQKYHKLNFKF